MLGLRSPSRVVLLFAYACVMGAAAIVAAVLSMPSVGVRFVPSAQGIAVALSDGRRIEAIPSDTRVTFSSADLTVATTAAALVSDYSPDGSWRAIHDWYADRDRLASVLRAPEAVMTLATPGGRRTFTLQPRPRRVIDLSLDVWLLLAQGALIGLVGAWMLVLRPRDPPAQCFALASAGILIAAYSGALFDGRELAAGGLLLQTALTLNDIGSNLSAAALLGLFLVQPRTLAGPITRLVLVTVAVAAGLASGLGLLPLSAFYVGLLAFSLATLVAFLVQWRRSKGDPAGRAILRWVGVTVLGGTMVLSLGMAAPVLFGTPPLGGDGLSFVPLAVIYGGVALGVRRHRLFSLDRWAFQIVLGALAAMTLLTADILLAVVLKVQGPTALAVAVLIAGYLYFPVRALFWRRIAGRPPLDDTALVQGAVEVAFAADPQDRRAAWRALLNQLFAPLEIHPTDEAVDVPRLIGHGEALAMPAAVGESALLLRFRDHGRKLFTPAQVRLASEIIALTAKAEQTREAYTRGVFEERQRIARDLHDDVSARLLTSLHRTDVSIVRADVRKAMAEIRSIVSSLAGEKLPLDGVVADLRFETAERLGAADVRLNWETGGAPLDDRLLDYPTYRGLVSAHREVVSNILQHAGARHVSVSVAADAGRLRICVEDDGRGSALRPSGQRVGNGLRNMQARLGEICGDCNIHIGAGGARVSLTIPLPAPAQPFASADPPS